jgi:hypothetical protein
MAALPPYEPPPAPGTVPLVDAPGLPTLRGHRPDAAQAEAAAREGRLLLGEAIMEARLSTLARDEAAARRSGAVHMAPDSPQPGATEAAEGLEHALLARLRARLPERQRRIAAAADTQLQERQAQIAAHEATTAAQSAADEVGAPPASGTALTSWRWHLVVIAVILVVEWIITKPGLLLAGGTGANAGQLATALVIGLGLLAEGFGLGLAWLVRDAGPRAVRWTLAVLGVLALTGGGLAAGLAAQARETNERGMEQAQQQLRAEEARSPAGAGSLSGAAESARRGSGDVAGGAAAPAVPPRPKADVRWTAPLAIGLFIVALLVALRSALAHGYVERLRERREADAARAAAEAHLHTTERAREDAAQALVAHERDTMLDAQQTQAAFENLVAFGAQELDRWAAAAGLPPVGRAPSDVEFDAAAAVLDALSSELPATQARQAGAPRPSQADSGGARLEDLFEPGPAREPTGEGPGAVADPPIRADPEEPAGWDWGPPLDDEPVPSTNGHRR